jgi:hypothetical protein
MADDVPASSPRALVPVRDAALSELDSGTSVARLGLRALSALSRNQAVRKAALAGAAFGMGYQLSRMARSGTLPQSADGLRDLYRVVTGAEHLTDSPMASGWVRESVIVISAVYGFLDRDNDDPA